MGETLSTAKIGRVGLITLEFPKRKNALNKKVIGEIIQALDSMKADDEIRAIVLTGSQGAFCAGADISEVAGLTNAIVFYHWVRNVQRLFSIMEDTPKPIIAAVNGLAMGGGLELSLACDFRFASESAVFGVPEINIGVLPGTGGMSRLPRLVGQGMAKELIYTGRRVEAEEALKIGLVNRVLPNDQLLEETIKIAELIASKPPITIAVGKSTLHQNAEADLKTAAEIEAKAVTMLFDTEDRAEGMKAFLEKRSPVFRGR